MKESSPSDSPRSPVPFEELLSAYHDGELSPEEREAVERQLASSPKARRQLQELQQMSGMLHGLPQSRLPQEFSRQVLRQAEQEMLIPRLRGAVPVARRTWPRYLVSLTAIAAALLISVFLIQSSNRDRLNTEVAVSDALPASSATLPQKAVTVAPSTLDPSSDKRAVVNANNGVEEAPAGTTKRSSMLLKSIASNTASTEMSSDALFTSNEPLKEQKANGGAVAAPAMAGKSMPPQILHSANGSMQLSMKDLTESDVGKFFNVKRLSGNQALLVRVVVVDLREGREAVLQVVEGQDGHDRNDNSRRDSEKSAQSLKDNRELVAKAPATGSEGILYETTTDQFANLVKRLLNQETAIAELQVDQPVDIDGLLPPAPAPTVAVAQPRISEEPGQYKIAGTFNADTATRTHEESTNGRADPVAGDKPRPDGKNTDQNVPPLHASSDLTAGTIARGKSSTLFDEVHGKPGKSGGKGGGGLASRTMATNTARASINQAQPPKAIAKKKEPTAQRNRTQIVQIKPELLNRKSGVGLVRRQVSKRAPEELSALDRMLKADNKTALNAPADADQSLPNFKEKVASAPAAAPAPLPLHVLFVLEQQSPAIPIESSKKARRP